MSGRPIVAAGLVVALLGCTGEEPQGIPATSPAESPAGTPGGRVADATGVLGEPLELTIPGTGDAFAVRVLAWEATARQAPCEPGAGMRYATFQVRLENTGDGPLTFTIVPSARGADGREHGREVTRCGRQPHLDTLELPIQPGAGETGWITLELDEQLELEALLLEILAGETGGIVEIGLGEDR